MDVEIRSPGWRERDVQEWLLHLLRFAVTRAPTDQASAFALATVLDAAGGMAPPSGSTFFRRTSRDLCLAILALPDSRSAALLRIHLSRIENLCLRSAFRAAVGFDLAEAVPERVKTLRRARAQLWKGLPAR